MILNLNKILCLSNLASFSAQPFYCQNTLKCRYLPGEKVPLVVLEQERHRQKSITACDDHIVFIAFFMVGIKITEY